SGGDGGGGDGGGGDDGGGDDGGGACFKIIRLIDQINKAIIFLDASIN
ncbi:unnamed protein product, partial [Rotaria sordida]